VVGWSHKRGDIRSFILDRVVSPVILEENWLQKPKMNVDALIFRFNEQKNLVVLEVENSEIERMRAILPAKIIKLEEVKLKKIRLCFEFDNMPFLNQWLLQFGTSVKIIKPETLISLQKKTLQAMINNLEQKEEA
jgi:predicted DNA-binding transcriptional regulator YafY